MKIVVVSEWYSEHMGYTDNCLPAALAVQGHDVHLVTSDLKPYGTDPTYPSVYEPFLGPAVVPVGTSVIDGVTVHRLPHRSVRGRMGLQGLGRVLRELRPDVVQVLSHASVAALQAAVHQVRGDYALFTANHVLPSVFPPAQTSDAFTRWRAKVTLGIPGRFVASRMVRCYAATDDCAEIAHEFFGVPRDKLAVRTLGVATDVFHPVGEDDLGARARLRAGWGVEDEDIVCLYTGRFSTGKDPAVLARAIARLDGQPRFHGVFVGDGPQRAEIESTTRCAVIPFVPFHELGAYHRAVDIGVWPRQESMSVLDARASGLPVVISDRVRATDRLGPLGSTYREGDPTSLADAISAVAERPIAERRRIAASDDIAERSWRNLAVDRALDYEIAVRTMPRRLLSNSSGGARVRSRRG